MRITSIIMIVYLLSQDIPKINATLTLCSFNKWLKEKLSESYVIHGFRHSFRDRLRAVECPSEIIDQLGGWSQCRQGYGKGELSVLGKWLLKI